MKTTRMPPTHALPRASLAPPLLPFEGKKRKPSTHSPKGPASPFERVPRALQRVVQPLTSPPLPNP